ncbi:MAG: U32 family peptidase [Oscillospiraceae bacterium]|nr:U32 family peptidase [Oscillospiraceae bacterium]
MTELLAPAGSREALIAAVQNGADAVYLGVDEFNARRGARNFTLDELRGVVSYCHLRGVRVYLTLNTLINDRELHALSSVAHGASEAGVDAILVQDWGVVDTLRRVVPDVPLHASTQMTVHTLSGIEEAARLGITRVVLSRELNRDEIASLCLQSPIELEVFVHGALCVCVSGQCAMSAVIGQRSGNRGLCAQPCRLPYNGGHPLSLRDNNLADYVPELQDMGVACLKLEGRMKRPEYVAAVTGIYARLLREHRKPTDEERAQLAAAFSRDGFTDGYYTGKHDRAMFGVRSAAERWPEDWFARLRAEYEQERMRTVPVRFSASLRAGEPITLRASDGDGHTVSVTGPRSEAARTRALTAEEIDARLRKTGGTAFTVSDCAVELDGGLAVSAAALNALRRDALSAMEAARTALPARRSLPYVAPEPVPNTIALPRFTVSLHRAGQLTDALVDCAPAMIALPIEELAKVDLTRYPSMRFCAILPRVYRTGDEPELRALLTALRKRGLSAVGVGNLGHLALVRDYELEKRGELSLNVFNSAALRFLKEQGLDSAAVSFELRREQIRDLQKCLPCEAVIYGRLPLMIIDNRIDAGASRTLTDRRNESFPVLEVYGGRCEIENAKTLYLGKRSDWQDVGLSYVRLRFTTESPEQCAAVLRAHVDGVDCPPEDLTRGLFYRGVE